VSKCNIITGEDKIIIKFDTLDEKCLDEFDYIKTALANKYNIHFIRWTVDESRYWEGHLKPSLSGLTVTKLLKIIHKILDEVDA
jgi:hypothetical protein